MPHAIQFRQTGGSEVLNRTAIEVGEPGPGQVRPRRAAGARNLRLHHPDPLTRIHRSLP
jgi:PIN domain nuclease of toxin-antitoxin system